MRAVQHSIRCALISIGAVSCTPAVRSGPIIEHYRAALCVEPSTAAEVSPPTRGWNADVTTAGGAKVTLRGAEMVGGRIVVRYHPGGPEVVAADAGDYVYPSDVRINEARTTFGIEPFSFLEWPSAASNGFTLLAWSADAMMSRCG